MKRKKELIVILSSLLVIVLSVSVAYFTIKILGTEKDITVTAADLKVTFTSGSGTINGSNIEPGWSSGENTFTVKNESNGTYNYNIVIKDLVNTFVTTGFLQYKITSTDGGYNMTDFADVPKSSTKTDTVLAKNISLAKGATHTYKVIFNYSNSDTVDQSEDMKKVLSGNIFIEKYETYTVKLNITPDGVVLNDSNVYTVQVEKGADATFNIKYNGQVGGSLTSDSCNGVVGYENVVDASIDKFINSYTVRGVTENKTCNITLKRTDTDYASGSDEGYDPFG